MVRLDAHVQGHMQRRFGGIDIRGAEYASRLHGGLLAGAVVRP
jgi:hypothetical protein